MDQNQGVMDGVATLRAFLDEVWGALKAEQAPLNQPTRFRLDYMRNELLQMQDPREIANSLYLLGRQVERHQPNSPHVIAFFQFALQCNPDHGGAMTAAIRKFRRLGRWSMVLKLLRLQSDSSPGVLSAESLVRMAHIYLSFYNSRKGLSSVLSQLRSVETDTALSFADELWLILIGESDTNGSMARLNRVVDTLNAAGDIEFSHALMGRFADLAVLRGDLASMLSLESKTGLEPARRLLLSLRSLIIQRRVPQGVELDGVPLTDRARLSLEMVQALLYERGFFDQTTETSDPRAWLVAWLIGAEARSSAASDQAMQYAQDVDELRELVHLVVALNASKMNHLSPIQRRYMASSPQLLCILRMQQTLLVEGRLEELAVCLELGLTPNVPAHIRRIMSFRKAQLKESQSDFAGALAGYRSLLDKDPSCWISWSSVLRVMFAMKQPNIEQLFESAPLRGIDAESHRVVEAWIALEQGLLRTDGSSPDISKTHELRARILGTPSGELPEWIWPVVAPSSGIISLHTFLAIGWTFDGAPVTNANLENLLELIPDTQDAYGLALGVLQTRGLDDDALDEHLAIKLPQQSTAFLAVAERTVRRRSHLLTPEHIGDLGSLLSRRFEPSIAHELVSARAWNLGLHCGKWTDAITVWRSLLGRAVGCLSAELGMLCGLASAGLNNEELTDALTNLDDLFSDEILRQISINWFEQASTHHAPNVEPPHIDSQSMGSILSGLRMSQKERRPEDLARWIAILDRHGCSMELNCALNAHLAEAQELGGDVLSALRTHQSLMAKGESTRSKDWLLGWILTNPDPELADLILTKLTPGEPSFQAVLDMGHVLWSQQRTADAIRAFTRALGDEQSRAQGLLELGTRLGEHGRAREAGQFYLELVRVTRCKENRKALLKQALSWFEDERAVEKSVEVLALLYQEHAGDYTYIEQAKALFIKQEKLHELADFFEQARALSLASSDQVALELIALYARKISRPDSARRVCLELMKRAFHLDQAMLRGLAEELSELNLWDEASTIYEKLLEATDVQSESYDGFAFRLASIRQEKLGDLLGARSVLESILLVRPSTPEALERIALLSCYDGTATDVTREALKAAIDIAERGENRARLLLRLADLEINAGDEEKGLKIRTAALSDNPGNLALVGTVISDLVARGRGKEASAALLKFELLNPERTGTAKELEQIRELLKSNGISTYMSHETTLQSREGGGLIVRQLLDQTSDYFQGSTQQWLKALSRDSVSENGEQGSDFIRAAQVRSMKRLTATPKNTVLEILSWLDAVFSVFPNVIEQPLQPEASSEQIHTHDDVRVHWAPLPIHTAYFRKGSLYLSQSVRDVSPDTRDFIANYFTSLNALNGLVFTRWAKSELIGLAEEFCRAWFEMESPSDRGRAQIHDILARHSLAGFSEDAVSTFRQHIKMIDTMSEGVVGSALELALFKSGSVHAAFEAMRLLDESLEKYHRGGETLLAELLPRTMLRHQSDYEAFDRDLSIGDMI